MQYVPDYEHVKCDYCGGTIGNYDRLVCHELDVEYSGDKFICGRCGKEVKIYNLKYDRFISNEKTGWLFPVVNLEE